MPEWLIYIVALIVILIGCFFSVVGVVGLIRLPDVYTQLHATGKVSVFGVVFLVIAAIFLTPLSLGVGLVLMALLIIAGPVLSHAIASAAYRIGIPMRSNGRDDLKAQSEADEARRASGRGEEAQSDEAQSDEAKSDDAKSEEAQAD